MADIATIRRRRLEALAANSAQAARPEAMPAEAPAQQSAAKSGGKAKMGPEETQDAVIPSEFECILCLRCV